MARLIREGRARSGVSREVLWEAGLVSGRSREDGFQAAGMLKDLPGGFKKRFPHKKISGLCKDEQGQLLNVFIF